MLNLLLREVAPGVTLRNLAWRLYQVGAYTPPRSEWEFRTLVALQRRAAESLGAGLSRIVPKMPYSPGNRKIGNVWSFDLPPVLTCPHATFCGRRSFAGFRGPVCYDVNIARYSLAHLLREYINYIHVVKTGYEWLRGWTRFVVEQRGVKTIRLHVGGDIFARWYWEYIKRLAQDFPQTIFYLYTRSFPIVASAPERLRNLKILMSLDATNLASLYRYGEYFDHITYLVVDHNLEIQLRHVAEVTEWAARRGKRFIIFLEHRMRGKLYRMLGPYRRYVCPQEAGEDTTCDKCKLCFT